MNQEVKENEVEEFYNWSKDKYRFLNYGKKIGESYYISQQDQKVYTTKQMYEQFQEEKNKKK